MVEPTEIVDGIYFGMPSEVYHDVRRLSSTRLQKLLVSPGTFWAESWLNPNPRQLTDDQKRIKEMARLIGSAYHCARLEPEALEVRYVRELDKLDMPTGTLFTGKDMEAELERRELKKSGSVMEQATRLRDSGFEGPIWHLAVQEWEANKGDRQGIPAKSWDEMHVDMEIIRASPEVSKLLTNGAAEVSVFWTDDKGVPLKARFDYLTVAWWVDFKTFANVVGKALEQAISDAFKYNRYHVQAAHYRDAMLAILAGLPVIEGTDENRELIAELQLSEIEPSCWYVFQEKGGIPNLLAKRVRFHEVPLSTRINDAGASEEGKARMHAATRQPSVFFIKATREIAKAKRLYRAYSEIYEPGQPWLPFNPLGEITDMDFSSFWLDQEIGE